MTRWEDELARVDWEGIRLSSGYGSSLPASLTKLASSSSEDEARGAYWELDNSVVVQGSLFQAAEYVIPYLLHLLLTGSELVQRFCLELLIQLASGQAHPNEAAIGNGNLGDRCRRRARAGLASFYALLDSPNIELRDRAVELIGFCEDDDERKEWTMRWIAEHDPDPKVRSLASRLWKEVGLS